MKAFVMPVAAVAIALLAGCDNITGLDNRSAPNSDLTGRVVYQGNPVGVRTNGVQLELWEPAYFDRYGQLIKIPVHIAQDGTFAAKLFDGTYKLNLLPNNGPWLNSSDTTLIQLNGRATVDVEVTPYYTVENVNFTRGASTQADPGGTITATFRVGQINTSRDLELVGVYVAENMIVDRINQVARAELTKSAIQTELDANGDITITVDLPDDIYSSNSPWVREMVFARVGVKTVGIAELLYSQVVEVPLGVPAN